MRVMTTPPARMIRFDRTRGKRYNQAKKGLIGGEMGEASHEDNAFGRD